MFSHSLSCLAVLTTALTVVKANPIVTAPPAAAQASVLPSGPVSAIDIGQCLATLQCCQSTIEFPVLNSILPIPLPSGVPLPSLGPLIGLQCSGATDLNIFGNQCLQGGTPVCCQDVILGIGEGCELVTAALPTILPSLPPISIPGLPPITLSLPLLPPITIGGSSPTPSPSNPLGISLPIPLPTISLPLPISLPFGLVEESAAVPTPSSD